MVFKGFPVNGEQINIRSFNAPPNAGEGDQAVGLGQNFCDRTLQIPFKVGIVFGQDVDVDDFTDYLETPVLVEHVLLHGHAQRLHA